MNIPRQSPILGARRAAGGGAARALLALALLAPILACSGLTGGDDEKLDENLIRPVTRGDLVDEVSEAGKITPRFDVDIKSKVSGEVLAVHVEEGQIVKKGDLLYEILDTEYSRNVALARVALKQAQLQAENAEVDRQRKEQALATRGISQAEYDVARREVELAKVNIDGQKVQLQSAQDQLDYTKIRAPIDGVVIVRSVEPGEVVTAGVTATVNGEAQMTIAQMDKLLLEIDLNQVDVAKVDKDQASRILLDAYPGEEVPGTVTQIAAAGHTDPTRGIDVFTVKVEVDPSKSKVEIKPGMTAEVRIQIGTWPNVVKLPAEMVFEEEGKSYVFKVHAPVDGKEGDPKVKEKTEITIGHRSDREVEVLTGIAEGDEFYAQAEIKDMSAKID
jgi:HlyD family secretion protein